MSTGSRMIVGVDIGGTFTDVFFLDEAAGTFKVAKVPTTPEDRSRGFIDGIASQISDFVDLATVVHGTTAGTNALLERKGAPTGIITTAGFRDVLEMRRRDRPETWGLWGQFEPVVPRDMRLEVPERTLADGSIHTPVDIGAVKAAAANLREAGAEAVAIVFMNSYANPANERAAAEAVRTVWKNEYVEISSDILPEIREFERTSTTVLNAYLQPTLALYFTRLETALKAGGFDGQVLIVQSNGGVMTIETARRRPIRTALSGPAAGVMASAHIAGTAGYENVITCDMGGTSFDVSLVAGGKSALSPQTAIDFGMVVRTPMIEITTIGAGGGSIAWVDRGGLLQVGPESAGSDPGPVCYGLGNDRPTVTDANLVLGRINADRPIGGKLDRLDAEAAGLAIERYVGTPLGLDRMAAAEAVIRVANSKMAGAIRLVSIERGHDPSKFVAMPFGGGGALHAGALIQEVGLAAAVVPRFPGINSALGCVIADMRHDFVQTVNGLLPSLDLEALGQEMAVAAASGLALLDAAEVVFSGTECVFELDMSYQGQTHTLDVTLPVAFDISGLALSEEGVRMAFESRYRELYGRPLKGLPERVLNFRVAVIGHRPKFDLSLLAPDDNATLDKARSGSRRIWVDGGWHDAAIFARLDLPVGAEIGGPAILEQPDTTILIEPGLTGTVDAFGNLIVRR